MIMHIIFCLCQSKLRFFTFYLPRLAFSQLTRISHMERSEKVLKKQSLLVSFFLLIRSEDKVFDMGKNFNSAKMRGFFKNFILGGSLCDFQLRFKIVISNW